MLIILGKCLPGLAGGGTVYKVFWPIYLYTPCSKPSMCILVIDRNLGLIVSSTDSTNCRRKRNVLAFQETWYYHGNGIRNGHHKPRMDV